MVLELKFLGNKKKRRRRYLDPPEAALRAKWTDD